MRYSLSCSSCRRSKVKCVNTGRPPCQRCGRSKISGCTLSLPQSFTRENRPTKPVRRVARDLVSEQAHSTPSLICMSMPDPLTDGPSLNERLEENDIDSHLSSLPKNVIFKAIHVFSNKFLELPFLHVATFMRGFESVMHPPETKALLGAVLAVIKLQPAISCASWAGQLLSSAEYITYVREALSISILGPPKVEVVQTLLIMSLQDWGSKQFHKAWVYCGVAIRIMQAINSSRIAPYPLEPSLHSDREDPNGISFAIETRTYWACFIMDCMINSGTYNPPMLPMSEIARLKVAPPLSAVDFAFGPACHNISGSIDSTLAVLDITQSVEALVGGFDIWAQIMSFVFHDGRKAPGMCAPHNCPWISRSPWSKSWSNLKDWRAKQHQNLHYPGSSVAVYTILGYGEAFTYLNLLYYVSVLVLHREYIPFLPAPDSVPIGPVDPPLLEDEAPAGWWDERAAEIFGAAEYIARLLEESSEIDVLVMTPFVGFCAFSAGYMCLYVRWFPTMNLDRSPAAEECLNICLSFLNKFRQVWDIAEGWIKTLHHASVLYKRAATMDCYRGKSRADFDTLHQSMNEFRAVDRSDQYSMEIDGASHIATSSTPATVADSAGQVQEELSNSSILLNQFMSEVGSTLHEPGLWSYWRPWTEETGLPSNLEHSTSL